MSAGHISNGSASLIATHRAPGSLVLDYRAYSRFGYRYSKVVGTVVGPLKLHLASDAESRTLAGAELRPQFGDLSATLLHA